MRAKGVTVGLVAALAGLTAAAPFRAPLAASLSSRHNMHEAKAINVEDSFDKRHEGGGSNKWKHEHNGTDHGRPGHHRPPGRLPGSGRKHDKDKSVYIELDEWSPWNKTKNGPNSPSFSGSPPGSPHHKHNGTHWSPPFNHHPPGKKFPNSDARGLKEGFNDAPQKRAYVDLDEWEPMSKPDSPPQNKPPVEPPELEKRQAQTTVPQPHV